MCLEYFHIISCSSDIIPCIEHGDTLCVDDKSQNLPTWDPMGLGGCSLQVKIAKN